MNLNDLVLLVRAVRAQQHTQTSVRPRKREGAAAKRLRSADLLQRDPNGPERYLPTRTGALLCQSFILQLELLKDCRWSG